MRDSGAGLSAENITQLFQEGIQFNANELQVDNHLEKQEDSIVSI